MSDRFLTIDVSSELSTLCEAQLRGTWQVPAELVRLALRLGAAEVSVLTRIPHQLSAAAGDTLHPAAFSRLGVLDVPQVRAPRPSGRKPRWARHLAALATKSGEICGLTRRRGFEISWEGPTIEDEVLADLRSALDIDLASGSRQRAIAALEQSGMEALLWAAGLRGARLEIACSDGDRRWDFGDRSRRRLRRYLGPGSEAPTSIVIRWRCAGLDQRRASRWLAIASRFAPARILVDGTVLPTGFVGGLYHLQLEEPVPCTLGLTRAGEDPVLWLLRDGVVSARASVPGYPPFEAAVELGGLVVPGASAADLRRAVTPYLGELVDRAVWMMVQVSARMPEMEAGERERLAILLLRAARKGIRTKEICDLSLLEMASEDDLRLSVDGIRQLADQRGGVLAAIEASERAAGEFMDPQSTLLASSEVRQLLATLTAVRFQPPSRRRRSLRKRVTDRLLAMAVRLRRRIRGLFLHREIPRSDQSPHESDVLEAIRSAMFPIEVNLCEGRGSTGRTARGLVVPRSHPVIVFGADLISVDAAWLYPLLLALDAGWDPPEDLRRRWLEAPEKVAVGK